MKSQRPFLFAWLLFSVACFVCLVFVFTLLSRGAPAPAQTGTLEAKMASVVKLRVQRPGKPAETASGIYVGKDSQYGYFITALHAVKVNPDPASQDVALVSSVGLQFKTSPQSFEAMVRNSFDIPLDLAVVQLPVANLPPSLPQLGLKDVKIGVAVHVLGHPAAGDWSVASGTVQNEITPSGDIHHFITTRDRSLAEGYSGGPVLDDEGNFLGMHTETTTTYGVEAKSGDIVAQLKAWRIPVNNFSEAKPPEPRRQSAEAEINKVVDAWEAAYSRKDAEALWKLWPSAPPDKKAAIQRTFELARSITLRLTERQIQVAADGMSATVSALSTKDVITYQGSPPPRFTSHTAVKLEKQKGIWLITSMT